MGHFHRLLVTQCVTLQLACLHCRLRVSAVPHNAANTPQRHIALVTWSTQQMATPAAVVPVAAAVMAAVLLFLQGRVFGRCTSS